jgi:hypothetical protein
VSQKLLDAARETMKRTCAYADIPADTKFRRPECDSAGIVYVRRNYWLGEARKAHGPHQYLCRTHGEWNLAINPGSGIAPIHQPSLRPRKRRVVAKEDS